MNTVVYADLLFLIDFSMDFLTFYIVSRILHQKAKLIRICSASAMGGIYSVVSLGMSGKGLLSLSLSIFVCFVMCMTAFLEKSPKRFSRMPLYTVTFFVVSSMLGGAMTALFYLFNRLGLDKAFSGGENQGGDGISVWLFAIFAAISGFVAILGGRLLKKKSMHRSG